MFDERRDLELYSAIFETRSLSQAAVIKGIAPGAVSKRLAILEAKVGARLFHRTTRSVQPTEEGKSYYSLAQNVLSAIQDSETSWKGVATVSGKLRVTASATFARMHLMPAVKTFLRRYPELTIELELTDRILDIVADGIDVAIRSSSLRPSGLVAKRIGSARRIVCASPEYVRERGTPKLPKDLENHNCIILNDDSAWVFDRPGKRPETIKVAGNLKCTHGDAMIEAAKSGVGVAAASLWGIAGDLRTGRLVEVLPKHNLSNQPSIYAVYASKDRLPARTRVFIEHLASELRVPD